MVFQRTSNIIKRKAHTGISSIQAARLINSFRSVGRFNSNSRCLIGKLMLYHVFPHNRVILHIHKDLLTFLPTACPGCCPFVGEGVKQFQYAAGGMARFAASYVCFTESNFNHAQNVSIYQKYNSHNKYITKLDLKNQIFGLVTPFRWTSNSRHF